MASRKVAATVFIALGGAAVAKFEGATDGLALLQTSAKKAEHMDSSEGDSSVTIHTCSEATAPKSWTNSIVQYKCGNMDEWAKLNNGGKKRKNDDLSTYTIPKCESGFALRVLGGLLANEWCIDSVLLDGLQLMDNSPTFIDAHCMGPYYGPSKDIPCVDTLTFGLDLTVAVVNVHTCSRAMSHKSGTDSPVVASCGSHPDVQTTLDEPKKDDMTVGRTNSYLLDMCFESLTLTIQGDDAWCFDRITVDGEPLAEESAQWLQQPCTGTKSPCSSTVTYPLPCSPICATKTNKFSWRQLCTWTKCKRCGECAKVCPDWCDDADDASRCTWKACKFCDSCSGA